MPGRCLLLSVLVALVLVAQLHAQAPPINGVRPAEVRIHALVGATIIPEPGSRIEHGVIVVRDGVIEAVGAGIPIPEGAWVHDLAGQTVTAGFIDAAVLVSSAEAAARAAASAGAHWSGRVVPQVTPAELPTLDATVRSELRGLGFATAAVYPANGIFRGTGAVLALGEEPQHVVAAKERAATFVGFEHGGSGGYPGSLMGSIAMVRQVLADAVWHGECRRVFQEHPEGNETPVRSAALEALEPAVRGERAVLFDCTEELNIPRAARIAEEFSLRAAILGCGTEFRWLDQVAATKLPIVLPLAFPAIPDISSRRKADRVTLRDLMTWEQAPTNPVRLLEAGATIAFTTHRLKKRDEFFASLRRAMAQGLTLDQALAALTVTPAKLLGLEASHGTIAPGKAANFAVFEGPLFEKDTKVRAVWVNGRRVDVKPRSEFPFSGEATFAMTPGVTRTVRLDAEESLVEFPPSGEHAEVKGRKATFTRDSMAFLVDGESFGVGEGTAWVNGVVHSGKVTGEVVGSDGQVHRFEIAPAATGVAASQPATAPEERDPMLERVTSELVHPLGEFGLLAPPAPVDAVLITNATIWTCADEAATPAKIERGWMRIVGGKIDALGGGEPPIAADVQTIDASGKHVTPGLIDCHSHTGISGDVNEGRQANTAEVSIGDVIDPDDIDWYRQLAGGLTACNQLHGSANPIGGRNSVVKLKWGSPAGTYPIEDAIPGIKFALGENVVRDRARYPNTRMGVEQFMRDAFTAARDYEAAWKRHRELPDAKRRETMPPRRDLELEVLVEILQSERLIHCHSYRQDEILMLIRLADDFGFRLGTLQHILEGYKVGEALAAHGVGASSFSDWWAYKMEVMDAIPYNGAILHELGVVVSFNSDSNELARRMNTEATKAVRYGGLDPAEALRFVTLNPAKQLRIDHRVGSLEPGKDADFVIWSGDPLSTLSRCEQTWIDGACMFSLDRDAALRKERDEERTYLLDKAMRAAENEKQKRRRERDEKEEKTGDVVPAPAPARPMPLLGRALEMRRQTMVEMVRRGLNPDEVRPGDCGCEGP
jgi:imidazolonepropionase-like amidohydrolase